MKTLEAQASPSTSVKYPGVPAAMDGTDAVVAMETAASEAAGAYPITPSTQMGEGWALAAAQGKLHKNFSVERPFESPFAVDLHVVELAAHLSYETVGRTVDCYAQIEGA